MGWVRYLFLAGSAIVVGFYVLLHLYYLLLLVISFRRVLLQPRWARLLISEHLEESPATPPVTLLVPAFNEQAGIVESVQALLGLRYSDLRVIVINDGSSDDTLLTLIRSFSLRRADLICPPVISTRLVRGLYLSAVEPRLLVVDKNQGGKSDALNAGINFCHTPWVCSVDADSILEEDALLRVMRPAVEDRRVAACSGIVRVVNGCRVAGGRVLKVALPRQNLAALQVVEYLQGFLEGRVGWDRLNSLLIISGAFGVFRTDVLRAIGGYDTRTVGEDMELVVRVHRYFRDRRQPYRVRFVPDPVCWTEVPNTTSLLGRQRRRWQRGLLEVLSKHRSLLFSRGSGTLGWLALPYFLLEGAAPVLEMLGFLVVPLAWLAGWLRGDIFLLYLVFALLVGVVFSTAGVLLEEFSHRRYNSWPDLLRLVGFAVFQHIGYHQMVVWYRLRGNLDYVFQRGGWGAQARTGFRAARSKPGERKK